MWNNSSYSVNVSKSSVDNVTILAIYNRFIFSKKEVLSFSSDNIVSIYESSSQFFIRNVNNKVIYFWERASKIYSFRN